MRSIHHDGHFGARCRGQPLRQLFVDERAHGRKVGARLGLDGRAHVGALGFGELQHPLGQGTELQSLEDLLHCGDVHGAAVEVVWSHGQLEIGDEPIEAAIALGAVALLAQIRADDSPDLVDVLPDSVERAVLRDPLDGRLLADLVDTRQIVAGLANEGSDLGVLLRVDAVALPHRIGIVALELADPSGVGIQQRHVIGDELNRVAVA